MTAQPTLVWIAGHMCDYRLWRDVGKISVHPNTYASITQFDCIEALAQDVVGAVAGPIIPIGFSMGAIVALMMARLAPERVMAMVLSSTNCTADLPERAVARLSQQAQVRDGQLSAIVRDELKPHYLSPATQGPRRQEILDLTFKMGMDLGPEVFLRQSEALRTRPALCDVISDFKGPVLVLAGADDTLCPPAWHAAMAARNPQANHVEIQNAGHLVPLEQPSAFRQTLSDWLTNLKITPKQEIEA
ncbi:MAG: alpha/beta fold hydrolase [Hyphomonadaceae bacterium]|uniref:alpha/beta fold hydrolase n=1 Tax=Aquidulcibacter sp. TaxID=2052990 RepID=UPI0022CAD97E|nr:alpha/beta fold hydrolase [Aquidulcibacter sp.]MCZ8206811.1 alpha/beta fold hydrolase [Aquidulcibacter sp.]